MGIKIKNLQTGEFEKFNIPALKGEKGEPGEIEPSEKVDYIGKQHSKLRDTMNANVDYIIKTAIGEFNYLDYEGQHITATNSIEGHARSAILSGQTLVNLATVNNYTYAGSSVNTTIVDSGSTIKVTINSDGSKVLTFKLTQQLKSNTKYMIVSKQMFSSNLRPIFSFYNGKDFACDYGNPIKIGNKTILTTTDATNHSHLVYGIHGGLQSGDWFEIDYPVLIEYQEGMENWDIPYFEGMQSVKMPVLTTTGKNLFDKNNYIEIGGSRFYSNTVGEENVATEIGDLNHKWVMLKLPIGKTYSVELDKRSTHPSGWTNTVVESDVNTILKGATYRTLAYALNDTTNVSRHTFTTTKPYVFIHVGYGSGYDQNKQELLDSIMLNVGSNVSTYEPYKTNILTTTSKNLFDMNRPYDNLTDSQATVVQDTNQIIVSSAESGIYVNANFILDKDFFAGKTVTGSCLYESDEKDIGTVQISYQDANGEYHYQWIKTPRTFTFPNSFIGDVMLSVSANNTGTPQSNTVTVKNIQLELGSTATPYEPYSEVVLRGIGDVQDTLDCLTGEVTERVGEIVLDGSEDWSLNSTNEIRNQYVVIMKEIIAKNVPRQTVICDKLLSNTSENLNNTIWIYDRRTMVIHSSLATVNELKAWLNKNPLTVQYELATPVVKTVDLSDNHVYSYKDVTHYDCSSAEGSLVPTLSVKVPTDTQLTIQEQKATTQTLLIKNMDLQQSIKEVRAMNLAFNAALYNSFNSIREEVEDIKKYVSTNENLEGSF